MAGDWSSTTLGEICSFAPGSAFPKAEQGDAVGKYPFIKVSDMNLAGNERCITTANNWVSDHTQTRLRAKVHPAGATVFAKIGVALTYNRRRILSQPTLIDNNMMAAIPDRGGVHPLFLYYLLCTVDFNDVVVGTALPYLNISDLSRIRVQLPSLEEQGAIACILGALDDKIELNRRMNQTLEAMARAIFKSWFVDFDPVRAKAAGRTPPGLKPEIAALFPDSFEDSELGEIPRGWRVISLSETSIFINGLALQKYPPGDGASLPVIKIAQLRNGSTDGADRASAEIDAAYIVKDGDVLFSWSGSLECILWTGGRGALNQHLFKVTSDRFNKWFYYLWIHHHLPWFRHIAAAKATTMGHIQRHHLAEAKVHVPPQPFLEIGNRIIEPLIDALVSRAIECQRLANLRDALLPKLLSGELRVPDAERIAGRCV